MDLKEQNILFFTRIMYVGGTENVIYQLCETFQPLVKNIVVCSCGGIGVKRLEEMGIKHYTIPDIEDKSPITFLKVFRAVKYLIKEENITIIHTHHRMAAFYIELMGLYKQCCFFNTSHNTFRDKRWLTRIAYKNANLIACGEMVKRNLVEYYGLERVTVIHNAIKPFLEEIVVDNMLLQARKNKRFLIGNVGRLSKQKGMEYFIQAIPLIISKHPEAEFYIIGSGEDKEKLMDMGRDYPLVFMGYRTDIQNLMCQLDLIVLSSLWEGLPLTPIEAFSVGRTVVATGVDGTIEIVENDANGLLVEPKNPQALADKICWMIEHPRERKQMENNAKRTYEEQFSFKKFSNSYINYYERL